MLIDVLAGLILTLKPFLILQNYKESKEKISFSNGVCSLSGFVLR